MSFSLPPGMRPAQPPQSGGPSGGGQGGQGPSPEEREAQQRQAEEMKRGMIAAMLESQARERLSRIALTRPELASRVEDLLIRMGQSGQIRGQVNDDALKGLLQQVTDMQQPKPAAQPAAASARTKSLGGGITIQRKRDDSDSDEYDL